MVIEDGHVMSERTFPWHRWLGSTGDLPHIALVICLLCEGAAGAVFGVLLYPMYLLWPKNSDGDQSGQVHVLRLIEP